MNSSFTTDLGLDSLDTVEVVMAVRPRSSHSQTALIPPFHPRLKKVHFIIIFPNSHSAAKLTLLFASEFSLEIDDASADQITTVAQAIEYISNSAEGQLCPSSPQSTADTFTPQLTKQQPDKGRREGSYFETQFESINTLLPRHERTLWIEMARELNEKSRELRSK